jgi:hypothetical protein
VDVAGQDTVDVPLHVDAAPDVRPPASAPAIAPLAVAPAKAAGHRSLAPAWIGFGVAAAGAFVSTYFGVSAIENKRDLDRQCTSKVCPPESRSLIDESNRNALVSTIGAVAGGVGVAFGVGWLVYAQSGEHAPAPSQTLRVTVGPLWAGAAGSF